MARPRGFDEGKVIRRALTIFWKKGYEATSIRDLEEATELSRISIYNTFGDKEGLFLQALDLYHNNATLVFGKIAQGGIEDIARFFEWFARPFTPQANNQSGCIMVNTVLDIPQVGKIVYEKVESYRDMLLSAYTQALENSRTLGEMEATDAEIAERAEFLVGAQWGAAATVRFHHSTAAVAPMNKIVCETIRSWGSKE
ncbi:MAG: helix-turn-helix domain-containing protein [Chloroflexota bacterium]